MSSQEFLLVGLRQSMKRALVIGLVTCGMLGARGYHSVLSAQETEVRLNRLIEALDKKQPGLSSETWAFVDFEHSPLDITSMRRNVRALLDAKTDGKPTLAPIVRIPAEGDELASNRWMIKQALDAGAMGIIVPKVESAAEARTLVQAMRYPQLRGAKIPEPVGLRGWGGPVAQWGLKDRANYRGAADLWPMNPTGELLALPQIESIEGLENVREILAVPGVAGIFIGPNDFAQAHGLMDPEHPEVQAALKRVGDACIAAKKYCGILATKPDVEQRYLKAGFSIIVRTLYVLQ